MQRYTIVPLFTALSLALIPSVAHPQTVSPTPTPAPDRPGITAADLIGAYGGNCVNSSRQSAEVGVVIRLASSGLVAKMTSTGAKSVVGSPTFNEGQLQGKSWK
jgi:hypothetical protein